LLFTVLELYRINRQHVLPALMIKRQIMALDPAAIRSNFPALTSDAIFFDNPGGTRVPQQTLDAVVDYLVDTNANHGGALATSQASDKLIHDARMAVAVR
jgi:selenocysteine lyase/cysteine desulfurase